MSNKYASSDVEPDGITLYIDCETPAALLAQQTTMLPRVFSDIGHAVAAALLALGWDQDTLEQVGVSINPGPEPHRGMWSVSISCDAAKQTQLSMACTAALLALRDIGYIIDDAELDPVTVNAARTIMEGASA